MGLNPGNRSGMQGNNRLSYGTVYKPAIHKYRNLSFDTKHILKFKELCLWNRMSSSHTLRMLKELYGISARNENTVYSVFWSFNGTLFIYLSCRVL
jgi:hypothetical protein